MNSFLACPALRASLGSLSTPKSRTAAPTSMTISVVPNMGDGLLTCAQQGVGDCHEFGACGCISERRERGLCPFQVLGDRGARFGDPARLVDRRDDLGGPFGRRLVLFKETFQEAAEFGSLS